MYKIRGKKLERRTAWTRTKMSLKVSMIMVGAKEELDGANGDEDELRLRVVSLYNITI